MKRIIFIILVAIVFMPNFAIWGRCKMVGDQSILRVINDLNCPILISEISDSNYGGYDAIEESELELVRSWDIEDKKIELFRGAEKGYLAILRKDDAVYCSQYINDYTSQNLEGIDAMPDDLYFYIFENSGSGIYVKYKTAFMLDGTEFNLIYWSPNASKPSASKVSSDESILSMCVD